MLYEAEQGDISIAVAGDAMIARRMRVFREITLPPTDSMHNGDQTSSNPGFGLMLALFVIAGIGLFAGYIVPKTSRLRREEARRR